MKEFDKSIHEEKQPLETVTAVLQECLDMAYDLTNHTSNVFERVAGGYPIEGALCKDVDPCNLLEFLLLLRARLGEAKSNACKTLEALG